MPVPDRWLRILAYEILANRRTWAMHDLVRRTARVGRAHGKAAIWFRLDCVLCGDGPERRAILKHEEAAGGKRRRPLTGRRLTGSG